MYTLSIMYQWIQNNLMKYSIHGNEIIGNDYMNFVISFDINKNMPKTRGTKKIYSFPYNRHQMWNGTFLVKLYKSTYIIFF